MSRKRNCSKKTVWNRKVYGVVMAVFVVSVILNFRFQNFSRLAESSTVVVHDMRKNNDTDESAIDEAQPLEQAAAQESRDTSDMSADGLVNINTADVLRLMTLDGVGEVRAQAIIDYRNEHGSFSSIDELLCVNGIGEITLEKLRDFVTV